ncbi:gamma-butyrobetaine hydroxylase-like domain-containing protein [Oceanicoccus sagamiensis]|uniref:1-(5-phosphoribosyl)-5-((5-phosphoribosylamino)methylideneamino)imidazole-4-carboxamide isomerase n=1 Tax=Oceanicoccus sagamiensis TaxID=716816 RepID=A0A1X9NDB7_9GAMM|nr:DUF971 domain-containing protein [Oceanicoccus sagamiensis]ARN74392.1 1-(5-phosphoribosyl)-5-((5-phosphoribosylamino)methylideneamino)imidazole-4-carboxamide isomerase [Oceanicoccus sagamiensis]
MNTTSPIPSDIKLHTQSKTLELIYSNNESYQLSCEYLRVYSPSAEVKGHGPGQEVLQVGKTNVTINAIEPVGNYALQLFFSDDHDSGIYSWDYFYQLATNKDAWWQDYLERINEAGASRDPEIQVVRIGN